MHHSRLNRMCIGSSKGPSTALRLKAENQAERSTLERWRVWKVWKVWRVWTVWTVWIEDML